MTGSHAERRLVRRLARDLASRMFADVVRREVLFIALVDFGPPGPWLASRSVASTCTSILDALSLFGQVHPLPCLPPQYATGLARFSTETARVLRSGLCSEHHLLALLESEVEGEFDWYFSEADRRRQSTPREDLVEKVRSLISPERGDRLFRELTVPTRGDLRGRLAKLISHPEYPFDSIAEAIRSGDAVVATRVAEDSNLLDCVMHKHGIQPADVLALANL